MGSKIERPITEDLESAGSMRSDQEHERGIGSIQEHTGVMGSKIERPITEDLESARTTRSDQERWDFWKISTVKFCVRSRIEFCVWGTF